MSMTDDEIRELQIKLCDLTDKLREIVLHPEKGLSVQPYSLVLQIVSDAAALIASQQERIAELEAEKAMHDAWSKDLSAGFSPATIKSFTETGSQRDG